MKKINIILILLCICLLTACDKYAPLTGPATVVGVAQVTDELSPAVPSFAAGQMLYLSEGTDTSTYIAQVKTDSMGRFSIFNLKKESEYTLYARYARNNLWYRGAVTFETSNNETPRFITLTITPEFVNVMSLTFADTLGGTLANLPFRIYSSRMVAEVDSVQYAYVNSSSDLIGQFHKQNVPAGEYFIVSSQTLGGVTRKALDSVTVAPAGISRRTVVLR